MRDLALPIPRPGGYDSMSDSHDSHSEGPGLFGSYTNCPGPNRGLSTEHLYAYIFYSLFQVKFAIMGMNICLALPSLGCSITCSRESVFETR